MILVPALETPASSSGRFTHITYPVHKAIVLSNDLQDLLAYGRFTARTRNENSGEVVKLAVGLGAPEKPCVQSTADSPVAVDLDLADQSVMMFRQSTANAMVYERGWLKSGIPELQEWLRKGTSESNGSAKVAVATLIQSLISDRIDESQSRRQMLSKRAKPRQCRPPAGNLSPELCPLGRNKPIQSSAIASTSLSKASIGVNSRGGNCHGG